MHMMVSALNIPINLTISSSSCQIKQFVHVQLAIYRESHRQSISDVNIFGSKRAVALSFRNAYSNGQWRTYEQTSIDSGRKAKAAGTYVKELSFDAGSIILTYTMLYNPCRFDQTLDIDYSQTMIAQSPFLAHVAACHTLPGQ